MSFRHPSPPSPLSSPPPPPYPGMGGATVTLSSIKRIACCSLKLLWGCPHPLYILWQDIFNCIAALDLDSTTLFPPGTVGTFPSSTYHYV